MTSEYQDKKNELPDEQENRIGWAYQMARRSTEVRERFDAWAKDYDQDVEELLGWRGPQATLDFVLRYVAKDAEILDAGSGTGLFGALLKQHGYQNLIATDISENMLAVARQKEVYQHAFQADLTQPLPIGAAIYDCVAAVGVSGYMNAETIGDFVRVLKPGGHIIYTISDSHFIEHDFKEVVNALIRSGAMEMIEQGDEFAALPKSDPDHLARVHVYKKAGKIG